MTLPHLIERCESGEFVAYIPLSQGKQATIDASDIELVSGIKWHAALQYNVYYAVSNGRRDGRRWPFSMHRHLLGYPEGRVVDHIDGNGLNNRRSNLRLASVSENARNTGLVSSNKSGFKGVSWRSDRGKWQVHIRVGGTRLSLGHYSDIEKAAEAYVQAAKKYHGEFANIGSSFNGDHP